MLNPLAAFRRMHELEQCLIALCVELTPTATFDLLDMPERAGIYGMFLIGGVAPLCLWSAWALRRTIKRAQAFERRADELARDGRRDELREHLKAWSDWIERNRSK